MQRIGRAEFLRGDWVGRNRATPLPWTIPTPQFFDACTRCDACIDACPQAIVERGRDGYPRLNFSGNSCTFCGECVQSCDHGAFHVISADTQLEQQPTMLRAVIHKECFAYANILCRACEETCDAEAISFRPTLQKVPQPEVDTSLCNGCGECYRFCPADAIRMSLARPEIKRLPA